jgi:predicted NAD/FAD-binding protein
VAKIAVIGGGVAGITAAWLLSKKHEISLFEADGRLGGHTNTIVVDAGTDKGVAVDTGFIVCNDRTYPNFHRLLSELGCSVRPADMSFGYTDEESGLTYSGAGLNGLFAQRSNAFRPSFWRLIRGLLAFHKAGNSFLQRNPDASQTLASFLAEAKISQEAIRGYVLPLGGAIWSAPRGSILEFPALSFLAFCKNHGLLGLTDLPQWQTVVGGSHSYLKAFMSSFKGTQTTGATVARIARLEKGVEIEVNGQTLPFDSCVVATHADQALALLSDADGDEFRLLSAWTYQKNRTVLHTDKRLLPSNPRARASWNYLRQRDSGDTTAVAITYDMNRLQGLCCRTPYLVTLNENGRVAPDKVIRTIDYEHPVYTRAAVQSQAGLRALNGRRRTWFCGSYFGWGFHEDAVRSPVAVARDLGVSW